MMNIDWSAPDDPEHFTPLQWVAYYAGVRRITPEEMRVPPVVVGTFQSDVWRQLLARTEAVPDAGWSSHEHRLARGMAGGREVEVARFMIGAPAAVIMMEQLIACGARRFVFVGTAGSLQPSLPIGSIALAESAVREDGTSFHYLPAEITPTASPTLVRALRAAAAARNHDLPGGAVWTMDAIWRELSSKVLRYAGQGVLGVEMEAAALFSVAQFRGVEAALIITMSDELFHPWQPGFHSEALRAGIMEALEIALVAAGTL